MKATASKRFYQLLDEGRKLAGPDRLLTVADCNRLLEIFGEMRELAPAMKDEVRERIMKRATAMYCHALHVPYSEQMRRQLGQESVSTFHLSGDQP